MAQPRQSAGFTVELGSDWEILAKMHIRVPRPWARIRLKPEDLGFLTWLLSHKPGQPLSAKFAADGLDCSPDRVETICKRLEQRNILVRRRIRDEGGRLRSASWKLLPPPEFQELARALAAVQGDPDPEFTGLDFTSENTPPDEAKPQVTTKPVKTRSGKTRSGKSGTKVVQEKESSRERNTHASAVEVTDALSGVEIDGGCVSDSPKNQPPVDTDRVKVGMTAARRGIAAGARNRLTGSQLRRAQAAVEQAVARGCTPQQITAAVRDEHTDDRTTHPGSAVERALDGLEPAPEGMNEARGSHRDREADEAAAANLATMAATMLDTAARTSSPEAPTETRIVEPRQRRSVAELVAQYAPK